MVNDAVKSASPAQEISAGYATSGKAVELGAVVVDGAVDPQARVRIPLAMVNRHGLVAGATGTGKTKTLQLAVVFAAFVDGNGDVVLGEEHQRHEWLTVDDALARFAFPLSLAWLRVAGSVAISNSGSRSSRLSRRSSSCGRAREPPKRLARVPTARWWTSR